jgi:hypothetical protein
MPDIRYSIRIVDEDGNGIPNEEVFISYSYEYIVFP